MEGLTIAGAIICILYGGVLIVACQHKLIEYKQPLRIFGSGLCVVGIIVLTSFALTEKGKTMPQTTEETLPTNLQRIQEDTIKTRFEAGPRPTKNHVAFWNTNSGNWEWITAKSYQSFLTGDE